MKDRALRQEITQRLIVWLALVALLAATIALTFVPLGPFRLAASLLIATAKAVLIGWIYMGLSKANGMTRLAACVAWLFIGILVLLTCLDFAQRHSG